MEKLRILYATMEIDPFLKITDAADFIRLLPQGLQEQGHEIRILMPKFGVINERRNRLHEVVRLSGINIRVGNEEKPLTIKVATIQGTRLQVYFLDNEDYFTRKSVLTCPKSDEFHPDNDERAIFFCKGVIETVQRLGWTPHIIHCHGWMTSLIPLYIKTYYNDDPFFQQSKVVYTLYDSDRDAPLPQNFAEKAAFDDRGAEQLEFAGQFATNNYTDMSASGVLSADFVARGREQVVPALEQTIAENKLEAPFDHNGVDKDSYINYYSEVYKNLVN